MFKYKLVSKLMFKPVADTLNFQVSEGAKKINWDGILNVCELYAGHLSTDDADMGDVSMADVNLGLSFLTGSDRNLNIFICLFVLIYTFCHFSSLYYTFHTCNRNIRK